MRLLTALAGVALATGMVAQSANEIRYPYQDVGVDTLAAHGDVRGVTGCARSVDHGCVAQDQVVVRAQL